MEQLLREIDENLSNRYVVLDGDHDSIYVKDRESDKHFVIHVAECDE